MGKLLKRIISVILGFVLLLAVTALAQAISWQDAARSTIFIPLRQAGRCLEDRRELTAPRQIDDACPYETMTFVAAGRTELSKIK